MTYTNNLASLRKKAGLTQQEVATALGMTLNGYQNYEYGKTDIRASALRKLSDVFDCPVAEILGLEDRREGSRTYPLPLFGRIAAGTAREALSQSGEYYDTPEWLYEEHPDGIWFTVAGNSMNRLFSDGTIILVDPTEEIRDGDLGVVFVNGDDATVKRIFYEEDRVRLHPESYDPEYKDVVIDETNPDAPDFRSVGRVVFYSAPRGWRG